MSCRIQIFHFVFSTTVEGRLLQPTLWGNIKWEHFISYRLSVSPAERVLTSLWPWVNSAEGPTHLNHQRCSPFAIIILFQNDVCSCRLSSYIIWNGPHRQVLVCARAFNTFILSVLQIYKNVINCGISLSLVRCKIKNHSTGSSGPANKTKIDWEIHCPSQQERQTDPLEASMPAGFFFCFFTDIKLGEEGTQVYLISVLAFLPQSFELSVF